MERAPRATFLSSVDIELTAQQILYCTNTHAVENMYSPHRKRECILAQYSFSNESGTPHRRNASHPFDVQNLFAPQITNVKIVQCHQTHCCLYGESIRPTFNALVVAPAVHAAVASSRVSCVCSGMPMAEKCAKRKPKGISKFAWFEANKQLFGTPKGQAVADSALISSSDYIASLGLCTSNRSRDKLCRHRVPN